MLISEVVSTAVGAGYQCSEPAVRKLIQSGKLAKPRIDATGRYDFSLADLQRLAEVLDARAVRKAARQTKAMVAS